MILLEWYREWLEIRSEYNRPKVCSSCETLRAQLELANDEKEKLLNRIMKEPEPERTIAPEPTTVIRPPGMPWRVRQQILEREDREKARALKNAAQPDSSNKIEELEKELDVAEKARQ